MRRSSLALRLVLAAAVWTTAALGMAGLLLQQLFLDYLRRNFDSSVTEQLSELAGSATIGPDGEFALARLPSLPAFQRSASGSYWQVITPDGGVIRSPSLGPASLSIPPPGEGTMIVDRIGPEGEPLRMALRRVPVEGLPQPATVAVAFDSGELTRSVQRFGWLLAISLLTLGAGLLVAIFVQVRFGLAPLHRLRSALAEIRSGRRQRLGSEAPAELAPFVEEINALLDQVTETIQRARTHVGNLAHALNTPITVMVNEADAVAGPTGEALRRQLQAMKQSVGHHLARARMAGAPGVLGMHTDAVAVTEDIVRAMRQIHRERGLEIAVAADGAPAFAGERQDCEEMIGNLMDNACKWARARVRLSIREAQGRLEIRVEDDGPGIEPDDRSSALARGGRLDEAVAGTGLGLAIVEELARLYGGSFTLGRSQLGGLCATLSLPSQAVSPDT